MHGRLTDGNHAKEDQSEENLNYSDITHQEITEKIVKKIHLPMIELPFSMCPGNLGYHHQQGVRTRDGQAFLNVQGI